jgi:hypothetical protein
MQAAYSTSYIEHTIYDELVRLIIKLNPPIVKENVVNSYVVLWLIATMVTYKQRIEHMTHMSIIQFALGSDYITLNISNPASGSEYIKSNLSNHASGIKFNILNHASDNDCIKPRIGQRHYKT